MTSKGPVVLYYTSGKDRTGFATALSMRLLGVNEQVNNENKDFFMDVSKYLKNISLEIDKHYDSVTRFFIEESVLE